MYARINVVPLVAEPVPMRSQRFDLAVALALAAAYRALFLILIPPLLDSADALMYLDAAERIGTGRIAEVGARVPLLYPLIAGTLHATGLPAEFACRAVSLLFGVLLVIPLYLLGLRLFGRQPARIAALTAAIWPWLADWSGRIAPESTALVLWFAGVYLLLRAVDGRVGAMWAAPFCFFALHLARPEGTMLLLFAPFAAALLLYGRPRRHALRIAPYIALCALLLAAQSLVSVARGGGASVNARIDPQSTLHYVFVQRGAELVQALSTTLFHNLPVMLGPILLALAGAGLLIASAKPRDARAETYVLAFAAAHTALAVLSTYTEPRYVMAPVVAVTLWSARGAAITAEGLAARGRPRLARVPVAVLAASMLLGFAVTAAPEFTGRMPREPREYKIAGEWMKANCAPGLIVVRKPQIGYYAAMPTTGPIPEHSVPRMLEWMRAIEARYLVVDERYTATLQPSLRPLLDPAKAPGDLRLVAENLSPFPGAKVVIYELTPQ